MSWHDRFEVYNKQGKGRPILFVEDNPMDIDLTVQAFAENQVANPIIVCRDGEEALNYSKTFPSPESEGFPILVLLDLKLPKLSGIEVLARFKADPVWKQLPITILTTSKQNTDLEAAYSLGVNSYIVKPVDFMAFSEVARRIELYWILTNHSRF